MVFGIMENFHELIKSKNCVFRMLKKEMHHAEQNGNFDWNAARNVLIVVQCLYYRGPNSIGMDGYFAAIYDLLQLYECKEAKVWNSFIEIFCEFNCRRFEDRLWKVAYYDFSSFTTIDPCQIALDKADIRGLRFLLQSGVQYFGLCRDLNCSQDMRPALELGRITEFSWQRCPPERRRKNIILSIFNNTLKYLNGKRFRDSCYEELGIDKHPSMSVQMSLEGDYFSVFKGNLEDAECTSQVPEKFRKDIKDWKFHFNYTRGYRMVFNTIPEPIVTHSDIKAVLIKPLENGHCQDPIFDRLIQEFPKIFPECTGPLTPRSLKHLSKCQLRQNIRMSHLFPNSILFSEAARALPLPEPLKEYVLDISDSWIYN